MRIYRTKDQLEASDNGYAFFGEARKLLGGQQATIAYNAAIHVLLSMLAQTSMDEIYEFLASKYGRWWAEQLNDVVNYHNQRDAVTFVNDAFFAAKINLGKAIDVLAKERTARARRV